ncbi:hypothetical protein ACSSS7_004820 [Eimeria intestinalis]
MDLPGVRRSESPEMSILQPAQDGLGHRLDDVRAVEKNVAGSFPLQRPAAMQTPRFILTAVLRLTVALTIAFLLQQCFYGLKQLVGAQDSASTLTGRDNARRLSDGQQGLCQQGHQGAHEEGGQEGGDAGAAGGKPVKVRTVGESHEGQSSARSRAHPGGARGRSLFSGIGRVFGERNYGTRGRVDFTSDGPPSSSEPTLLKVRKRGSSEASQGDGTAEGAGGNTKAGAASAPESTAKHSIGQHHAEHTKSKPAGAREGRKQLKRGALGRRAGRWAARLLAQASGDDSDSPGEDEASGASQKRQPISEATPSSGSLARGFEAPQKGEGKHAKAAGSHAGLPEGGNGAVGRKSGLRVTRLFAHKGRFVLPTPENDEPSRQSPSLPQGLVEPWLVSVSEEDEDNDSLFAVSEDDEDDDGLPESPGSHVNIEFLAKGYPPLVNFLAKSRRVLEVYDRYILPYKEMVEHLADSSMGDDDVFD